MPKRRLDGVECLNDVSKPGGSANIALTNPTAVKKGRNPSNRLQPKPPRDRRKSRLPTRSGPEPNIDNAEPSTSTYDDSISDDQLLELAAQNSPIWREQTCSSQIIVDVPRYCPGNDNDDVITISDDDEQPSSTYGLSQVQIENGFLKMPDDLVQKVFANLPVLDLLFIVNRVDRRFHKLISDPKFLNWKKLFHKYRHQHHGAPKEVSTILTDGKMSGLDVSLVNLIIHVHKKFHRIPTPAQMSEFFRRMNQLPLFQVVLSFLERSIVPELMQQPSVWAHLAAAVLLCEDVSALLQLIRKLTSQSVVESVDPSNVVECLYFIATLLLAFHRKFKLTPRLYYNLYSALYFFENEGGRRLHEVTAPSRHSTGQQNMYRYVSQQDGGRHLTFEQFRIVNYELQPDDCIKIIAFAGTGKTTTLLEYVKCWRNLRFLVLMFNKDVCEEAKAKFPDNAVCRTTHSLAYCHQVPSYGDKTENLGKWLSKGKLGSKINVGKVAQAVRHRKGVNLYVQAKHVAETITSFMASNDEEIELDHTPSEEKEDDNRTKAIPHGERLLLVKDAKEIWDKMIDRNNDLIWCVHDAYLKKYQLLHPRVGDYDVILIDEAQDMNPATLDVIARQNIPKMFVGDPNQQIYSFRGAVNALSLVEDNHTFYLTQSFRFGPEIAFIGNCYLNTFKNERKKVLLGTEKVGALDGSQPVGKSVCVITRGNATAFAECVKVSQMTPQKKLHILGGCQKFGFDDIHDIYKLMRKGGGTASKEKESKSPEKEEPIKNAFIARFKSLGDLEGYAKKVMDSELEAKIKIVKQYHIMIPEHLRRIKACHTGNQSIADFIVTTAHKAKGLEFDTVRLAGDFMSRADGVLSVEQYLPPVFGMEMGDFQVGLNVSISFNETITNNTPEDEVNLLYVALTRAKYALIMNAALLNFITKRCDDRFENVISSASAISKLGDQTPINCLKCKEEILANDENLVLFRRPLMRTSSLAVGRKMERPAGVWCSVCARGATPLNYEWRDLSLETAVPQIKPDFSSGIEKDYTRLFWRPFWEDKRQPEIEEETESTA